MNEIQDKVLEAMTRAKEIASKCSVCGHNDWEGGWEHFRFHNAAGGHDEHVIVLFCRGCGYVRRHSARLLRDAFDR